MEATLAPLGLPAMKVRERIRTAVLTRLDQAEPHREAVRRAAAILAQPQNAARAARTLWRTVDAIWRACGDTSTDYNFYTKRAILAGVYSVTLLVWLSDESEGRATTHAFLDRRIAGIMSFEKTKARVLGLGEGWPSLVRFLGRLRYPAV
jgi:ubiquinone biosynthesis protein COQ9